MPAWRFAAINAIERDVLRRASAVVLPSAWAKRSAVDDYGVAPSRVHVIPLGANLTDDHRSSVHAPNYNGDRCANRCRASREPSVERAAPTRGDLRLIITAADPVRKRLDVAVDATAELRARGWNARLTHFGGRSSRAERFDFVDCVGRLRHSDPAERARHLELIRESHFTLLPSAGEAFGIAPVEAAHLGRPSIASDAGGLTEVVVDGETGRVLPRSAKGAAYADAIVELAADPQRYRRVCEAALSRATTTLHWDRFAERSLRVFEGLAASDATKASRAASVCVRMRQRASLA